VTVVTKLAACRPVSIHFPALAILALTACSAGEVLSPPKTPSGYITKLVLTPDKQTTTVHQVVHLKAFAKSSTGDSVLVHVEWSATGGTVDSTGAFSATQPGTYQVVGTLPTGSVPPDTATISVLAAMAGVVLKPDSATLQPGGAVSFTVSGRLTDGSLTSLEGALFSATGGTITATGSFIAGNQGGTYQVIAKTSDGEFADTSIVKVSPAVPTPVLQAIEISPASVSLQTKATQQFSVIGRMSDGKTHAVSGATFTATGGSITAAGAYTAGTSAGSYRVVVKLSSAGFSDTATVKISLPPITSIVLTPASVSLTAGATQQFSVAGKRSDGSTATVTATFTALGGTITSGGAFTAGQTGGIFRVIAVQSGGSLADTSSVAISVPVTSPPPLTLQSVTVTPASTSLKTGATQQFAASGKMSDGSTASITDATWTATGGTVSTSGLYTAGQTAGTYRVIGAKSGKADTGAVTVTASAATLQTLTLTPGTATVNTGGTQQFTALGKMSDGSTVSITDATWTATGGTVSTSGLYTAGQIGGSFRVIAAKSGKSDTSGVTVTASPPTLQTVTLTPAAASIKTGATQQYSVSGKMTDGSTVSITDATWTATGGTISTSGLYTAGQTAGSYRVIAAKSGKADTGAVTVTTPVTLQSISVNPASVTLNTGATQQFSVSGKMSDGSSVSITNATWTASGGTVSTGGLYTAGGAAGSYSIKATANSGALSVSAGITVVTPAPPPPPPPTGGGNEPGGFSRIAEISFSAMPTSSLWSCSGSGVLAGCWFSTAAGASIQQDGAAPKSPAGVYRYVYPAGLTIGTSTGILGIWASANKDQFSQIYESGWLKLVGTSIESPTGGFKLLGYWGVGQSPAVGQQVYSVAVPQNGVANQQGSVLACQFALDIRQQNQVSRAMFANVNSSVISCNQWVRYEVLMTLNDIGAANGTLKMWINGALTHNYTDVAWRTSAAPSGFYERNWNPIWGGAGSVQKAQADAFLVDHIYISAVR
jgi:hypothetical protein